MPTEPIEPVIRIGEWLVIGSTLLGPILAVQAQKWLERRQAKQAAKDGIFRTLMATRSARLSSDHVQALNMISIAFYGRRVCGFRMQSRSEKNVTRAWRAYLDVLQPPSVIPTSEEDRRIEAARADKFHTLLATIAIAQGYDFDETELKNDRYNPQAHANFESQSEAARLGIIQVLAGERAIKMEVTKLPSAPPHQ